MCNRLQNSISITDSTKSPFEICYRVKTNIIGLSSDFGHIAYITKKKNIKRQMKDKTNKSIISGYAENHTRDTYKLYNPDTKRVIMSRYIKWAEWKMTDPAETVHIFRDSKEEYLVPGKD